MNDKCVLLFNNSEITRSVCGVAFYAADLQRHLNDSSESRHC